MPRRSKTHARVISNPYASRDTASIKWNRSKRQNTGKNFDERDFEQQSDYVREFSFLANR